MPSASAQPLFKCGQFVYAQGLATTAVNYKPLLVIEPCNAATGRVRLVDTNDFSYMRILAARLQPYASDIIVEGVDSPCTCPVLYDDVCAAMKKLAPGLELADVTEVLDASERMPSPNMYSSSNGCAFNAIHCLSLEDSGAAAWFMRRTPTNAPKFAMALASIEHAAKIIQDQRDRRAGKSYSVSHAVAAMAVGPDGAACLFGGGVPADEVARDIVGTIAKRGCVQPVV